MVQATRFHRKVVLGITSRQAGRAAANSSPCKQASRLTAARPAAGRGSQQIAHTCEQPAQPEGQHALVCGVLRGACALPVLLRLLWMLFLLPYRLPASLQSPRRTPPALPLPSLA